MKKDQEEASRKKALDAFAKRVKAWRKRNDIDAVVWMPISAEEKTTRSIGLLFGRPIVFESRHDCMEYLLWHGDGKSEPIETVRGWIVGRKKQ